MIPNYQKPPMIRVTIEVLPSGDESRKFTIGEMEIAAHG